MQPVEKFRVAEPVAQHLQHPARLGVDVAGVLVGIREIVRDDGDVIEPLLPEPLVLIAPEFVRGLVCAIVLLGPVMLEISSKAFVQPQVRPILCGYQVAEPLVRQLVRLHQIGAEARLRASAGFTSSRTVSVVALVFSMPPSTKSSTKVCAYCAQG